MDCSGILCRTSSISSLSSAGRNQMKEPDMRLIGIRSGSPGTKSFWTCLGKTVRADKRGSSGLGDQQQSRTVRAVCRADGLRGGGRRNGPADCRKARTGRAGGRRTEPPHCRAAGIGSASPASLFDRKTEKSAIKIRF